MRGVLRQVHLRIDSLVGVDGLHLSIELRLDALLLLDLDALLLLDLDTIGREGAPDTRKRRLHLIIDAVLVLTACLSQHM
jgi:hypothetical protein